MSHTQSNSTQSDAHVCLVSYIQHIPSRLMETFHKIMGESVTPGPLPQESQPLSAEQAGARLVGVANLEISDSDEGIIVHPASISDLKVTKADALEKLSKHWDSAEYDEPLEETELTIIECRRAWVFLIKISAWGIPPGIGLLVDKYSGQCFVRRYIDLSPFVIKSNL